MCMADVLVCHFFWPAREVRRAWEERERREIDGG